MDEQQPMQPDTTDTAPVKASSKNSLGPQIGIIGLIVIVVVAVVAFQGMNKPARQPQIAENNAQQSSRRQTQSSGVQIMKPSTYKDGTYTADGPYTTPEGPESIGVSITLKNDVVTDTSLTQNPKHRTSVTFQGIFAENYKSQVVGKNIADLQLGRVSGSSLTPIGFNNAVETIKSQAKG